VTAERTLGIAGVGLIGASIGLRAAAAGYVVHGWDLDRGNLARAREIGAITIPAADAASLGQAVETLVIAAPLDATLQLLAAYLASPPRATLILDVASVKLPVSDAGRALPGFVATHPIAGSERSGPAAADPSLFVDRVWTYDERASPADGARTRAFIATMGARPVPIDSADHDAAIALTSHLPQVVAVALGARLGERLADPGVADLCGTGMRSMLRLGASAWTVWEAVLAANRGPIAQEVRVLANVLFSLAETFEAGRTSEMATAFAASGIAIARLDAADGARRVAPRKDASDEREPWTDEL